MANVGFLTTVCVLAVLVGHVDAQQACTQATNCFNNLGINISAISPTTGMVGVLNALCKDSSGVLRCYKILTQCPEFAEVKGLLPGNSQMQAALTTLCQNKTTFANGFTCLSQKPSFPTEIAACATQIQNTATHLTPAQRNDLHGTLCSLEDTYLNCLTSMEAIRTCGSDFTNSLINFEKELQPENCPTFSGCSKLESWLFFGIIAALITSILQRL